MTDQKPRLDRFRDPKGWLLQSLPWPLRRLVISWRMREWAPNGARYIGVRRPPWEAFDIGRRLHAGCRCVWDANPQCPIHGDLGRVSSAATTAPRDLGLILRNRNDQLVALAHKHREKETALLRVCDAVTLAEAKRIAEGALNG